MGIQGRDESQHQSNGSHVHALASPMPMTSLDQLYAQAIIIEPLFRHKIERLAAVSGGCFYVSQANYEPSTCIQSSRLMAWTDIERDPLSLACVQWPLLKHVDRSVYNVSFFYHGDVSRLTDVVRQRLIFRSLADLESCLATILKDRELEVAGVKNAYCIHTDAFKTAGYRDMVLQLKLRNSATGFFGVSMHVCELQLVHSEMAGLYQDDRHRRILTYKDIMFRFHAVDDGRETLAQAKSALRRLVAMRLPCSTCQQQDQGLDTARAHLPGHESSRVCPGDLEAETHSESAANLLKDHGVDPTLTITSEAGVEILEPVMSEQVFRALRQRCHAPGGALNQRVSLIRSAVKNADTTMILFTRPIGAFFKWPASLG